MRASADGWRSAGCRGLWSPSRLLVDSSRRSGPAAGASTLRTVSPSCLARRRGSCCRWMTTVSHVAWAGPRCGPRPHPRDYQADTGMHRAGPGDLVMPAHHAQSREAGATPIRSSPTSGSSPASFLGPAALDLETGRSRQPDRVGSKSRCRPAPPRAARGLRPRAPGALCAPSSGKRPARRQRRTRGEHEDQPNSPPRRSRSAAVAPAAAAEAAATSAAPATKAAATAARRRQDAEQTFIAAHYRVSGRTHPARQGQRVRASQGRGAGPRPDTSLPPRVLRRACLGLGWNTSARCARGPTCRTTLGPAAAHDRVVGSS